MRPGRRSLLLAFLAPALLLYGYFVLSPYGQAFLVAGTDWGGLSADYDMVGLDNFKTLLRDGYVWNALKHNAILLVLLPVLAIALGICFATLLNDVRGFRGAAIYKVVYFFPQVLSVAVIGVLWNEIYNPRNGALNGLLRIVGLSSARSRPG